MTSSGVQDYSSKNTMVSRIYRLAEKTIPRTARNWARKQFFTPLQYPFKEEEESFLAQAKNVQLILNSSLVQVYQWGDEHLPVVILQHGWAGRATQFVVLVKSLIEQGYCVVAADAPAHGKSSGKQSSAFEFVELIDLLKEKYQNIAAYVGHSMGGLVMLNVLASDNQMPKVVTINTPTDSESVLLNFLRIIGGSRKTGEYLKKYIQQKYHRSFEELFAPSIPLEVAQNVLVINDKKDRQVPFSTVEKTKKLLPSASYYFTEGLGHTRILYKSEVVKRVVDFINA